MAAIEEKSDTSENNFEDAEKREAKKVKESASADDSVYVEQSDNSEMGAHVEFCLNKDDWDTFIEKMEMFFRQKKISQ